MAKSPSKGWLASGANMVTVGGPLLGGAAWLWSHYKPQSQTTRDQILYYGAWVLAGMAYTLLNIVIARRLANRRGGAIAPLNTLEGARNRLDEVERSNTADLLKLDAARITELEAQLAEKNKELADAIEQIRRKEFLLDQHINIIAYGDRILPPNLAPLNPSDSRILAEVMKEIQPFVDRAAAKMWELMTALLHDMREANPDNPRSDARYWLSEVINEHVFRRTSTVLIRFDNMVDANEDSREALAAFMKWYDDCREWLFAMGVFLGKPIQAKDEFKPWALCDNQYGEVLRDKIKMLPQLEAIDHYYVRSVRRFEERAMRGLPSVPNNVMPSQPESAS